MRKKKLIFVLAAILILVVVFIKFQDRVDLRESELNEMVIAFNPDAKEVKITDKNQISDIIETLDTEKWNVQIWWTKKCAPILYLIADEITIGFFGAEGKYCFVDDHGDTRYYKIPQNVSEQMFKVYEELSD